MCLPYSVAAMGPTLSAFVTAASPGYIPSTYDLSCLRCAAFFDGAVLPQVWCCRRNGRCDRLARRSAVGTGGGGAGALVTVLAMRGAGARSQEPETVAPAPGSRLQ